MNKIVLLGKAKLAAALTELPMRDCRHRNFALSLIQRKFRDK